MLLLDADVHEWWAESVSGDNGLLACKASMSQEPSVLPATPSVKNA